MMCLHEQHPEYGFAQHMGYPTEAHFAALKQYGACSEHRRSFSPVRKVLESLVS
jgi:ribonuclease HII